MTKPKIKLWKLKKEECHTEFRRGLKQALDSRIQSFRNDNRWTEVRRQGVLVVERGSTGKYSRW